MLQAPPGRSSALCWFSVNASPRFNGPPSACFSSPTISFLSLAAVKASFFILINGLFFLSSRFSSALPRALYDKYLVHTLGFSAVGVQVWFMIYSVPVMAFVLFVFWWPVRAKHTPFKWRWGILLIGALLAVADVAYFKALGYQGAMISLVTAVRSGSVVISFLGGAFIFGEVQIRRKAVALVGVIIGVCMLLLSH